MANTLTENINAEGAVLGSMLLDMSCIMQVHNILKDCYYFRKEEHRILYKTLCDLSETTGGWDLIVVRDALKERDSLDAVGGVEYLVKLVENTPTAANAVYYAGLVHKAYKRRRLAEQGLALHKAAMEPGDVQEALQCATSDLHELAAEVNRDTIQDSSDAIKAVIDDSIHHRRSIVKMPWSFLGGMTNALQPGTVTILCGSPGASKSFATMEILDCAIDTGSPAAIFELEDSKVFHLLRILAQKSELPGLTNPEWIAANPELSKGAQSENSAWLSRIGQAIDADGGGLVTYDTLTAWALRRVRAGCKLLIVDPVTAVQHKSQKSWQEDNDFLQKIKRMSVDYGASILLVTHPSKLQGAPGMEGLAGGATFSRFSKTVIWLEAHDYKTSTVRFDMGTVATEHNRTIHILKSSLGRGQGLRIAATFTDTLRLIEHGVIIKKAKE